MADTITINVSGTKYEVSETTFMLMTSKQSDAKFELENMTERTNEKREYFIERNPTLFTAILSCFQGHGLHLPPFTCIAEFKNELDYWGIKPQEMKHCCYSKYVGFFDDQKALSALMDDQTRRINDRTELQRRVGTTGWSSVQVKIWSVLEEPSFNIQAKVYLCTSALFVTISIAALVCGTHPTFMRELHESEWREYFGDEYPRYAGHFDSSLVTPGSTVPPLPAKPKAQLDFLTYLDVITTVFFSIDFVLRIVFCPNKKRFLFSFLNLVDMFALLVMYCKYIAEKMDPKEKYTTSIFDVVHCLQIIRVFRLFRLVKNFIGFRVLLYSIKASLYELLLMMLFLLVAMVLFSTVIFFSGDSAFVSIPDAFWWAVVTMTTVGYGDIYPTEALSKSIGSICAVTGLCLLAVIIPIFVNNFLLFYSYSKVWGGEDIAKEKRNSAEKSDSLTLNAKVTPIDSD